MLSIRYPILPHHPTNMLHQIRSLLLTVQAMDRIFETHETEPAPVSIRFPLYLQKTYNPLNISRDPTRGHKPKAEKLRMNVKVMPDGDEHNLAVSVRLPQFHFFLFFFLCVSGPWPHAPFAHPRPEAAAVAGD